VAVFEYDAAALVKTRRKLLDRAASENIQWFSYHAPFPALGNIKRTKKPYEFFQTYWQWHSL